MASFNSLCHQLIDRWVEADSFEIPEELFDPIIGNISIKMALSVVETTASDPYDWYFRSIKRFGYESKLLKLMLAELPNSALRNLERSFVDQSVIPAFRRAVETRNPSFDLVKTNMLGVRVGYERLIIPQKTDGVPRWCVSFKEGRFAIPSHQEAQTDLIDEGIIQLLIEGHTAKEIAEMLNLSPRTIEHRIDKMKTRFGAKNLVHLVARLVGTQVNRRDSL